MDYETEADPSQGPHPWFAVRVKSNCERTVATLLDQRGYQRFLPTCKVRTRWSDRIKTAERILFPGYVFCSFNPSYRLPILSTPGRIARGGGRKATGSGSRKCEMSALWTMLSPAWRSDPGPIYSRGIGWW